MKTELLQGFSPVVQDDARVLVLGSMPGLISIEAHEYYAHKQNCFWYIIGKLIDTESQNSFAETSYPERCDLLRANKIALWDVLRHCKRKGSLDSAIIQKSIVTNNFSNFLMENSQIQFVFFNGTRAMQEFKRHILQDLDNIGERLYYLLLPSTSPAMARLTKSEKLSNWKIVSDCLHDKAIVPTADWLWR